MARFILGAVFIYAAVSKFGSQQEFADSIASYRILPFALINVVAMGMPVFEFICGALVISGFFYRIGVLGVVAMLVSFMAALVAALARGLTIDCGCFGTLSWLDSNPWLALIRDGVLMGLAALVYWNSLTRDRKRLV